MLSATAFRPAPWILVLGASWAFLLLLAIGRGGPDFPRYLDWARVFESGDLFLMPGELGSPLGLPLSQWVHGPGAFFYLGKVMTGDFYTGLLLVGWIAAVIFWSSIAWTLYRVTEDDFATTLFGIGALFVGTHAGFYSSVHATESMSLGLLGVLTYLLFGPATMPRLRIAGISAATGLLLMCRPQAVFYAWPAMIVGAGIAWWNRTPFSHVRVARLVTPTDRDDEPTRRELPLQERLMRGALLLIPVGLSVVQVAWVNRWMTGSTWRSPYAFGQGTFRSFDWRDPEILAVLAHPWHGALIYHPLYAVGVLCLGGIAWMSGRRPVDRPRFWLAIGALGAILLNVYVQAAWYVWWLGTGTFGMRGVVAAAIPTVAAVVWSLAEFRRTGRRLAYRALSGAATLCCIWSFGMLVQDQTQFYTHGDVFVAQWLVLTRWWWVLALSVGFAVLMALPRLRRVRVWLNPEGALLGVLTLTYLLARIQRQPSAAGEKLEATGASVVGIVLVWVVLVLVGTRVGRQPPGTVGRGSAEPGEGAGGQRCGLAVAGVSTVLVAFLAAQALFLRTAILTETRIRSGDIPRTFASSARVYVSEVRASYFEYLRVEGFGDKKRALRDFLERETGQALQ